MKMYCFAIEPGRESLLVFPDHQAARDFFTREPIEVTRKVSAMIDVSWAVTAIDKGFVPDVVVTHDAEGRAISTKPYEGTFDL